MRLMLRNVGEGKLEAATALDRRLLSEHIPEGRSAFFEVKKPRSVKQNGFFFALIDAAWQNQRERGIATFDGPEHLRAWLLCQMGHCEVIDLEVGDDDSPERIENYVAAIVDRVHRKGAYCFFERQPNGIRTRIAKSWAFDELDAEKAARFVDETVAILTTEICPGATAEGLLDEAMQRAA